MTQLAHKNAPNILSPAVRTKAADNLRKAKVQLVLHQPFFASIVLKRTIDIKDDVPTAYVTANGKIVVGTEFGSRLTVQQMVFLLAHEAMHYAMMHQLRRDWRKPKPWNVACDYVINDILKSSGVGDPILDGLFMPGAKDKTSEQLYQEQPEDEGGEGHKPGNGNDDLSDEGANEVTPEDVENIKRELIQARQAAKSQGKMPAALEELIDGIINPNTPWHELLERFMTQYVNSDLSWKRPRRGVMASTGMYLPSTSKAPAMGTVVIQMDESGSIGKDELAHFSGHINKIIESCNPEQVIVLHTDSAVGKVEEFGPDDFPIQFKSYCGGGTDMCAGINWVNEQGIEPDVFVTLTDGYTPFPERQTFPMAWLITTHGIEAPQGETIYYEVTE